MTQDTLPQDIKRVSLEEEMKKSYLDYAMSVIVSRALPDVRDGLKPVHRRILFAMKEAGNEYNKPYRKSARVVGDVMGKYHPHGDSPIYDAMVRMAQPFSMRSLLIDGQGNFGSIDGDPPAAMRYTEARLTKQSHFLLEDIDKDTVDFQSNYDESLREPTVLPARFPNILINGANGIAVGMATAIPPHNLGEILDACIAIIQNPDLTFEELTAIVPAPDFPTGGLILGRAGSLQAFQRGRGSIVMRGRTSVESIKDNRYAVVIHELPYQVNKARLVERIAELVKDKVIEGVSDLRDESDRDGIRVVVDLKKDVVADVIINLLYKHTPLQSNFSANMLALHHGRPEVMNLRQMLDAFLAFREEIIYRRTRFELRVARDKAHLFLGLALAVANIDRVIELIRHAPDRQTAKQQLMETPFDMQYIRHFIEMVEGVALNPEDTTYYLTENQAVGILDLRLHRLTNLERDKILLDLQELVNEIEHLLAILRSRDKMLGVLTEELLDQKNQFATPRRSEIVAYDGDVDIEDLIQEEDMVVTVSMEGYIKRVPLDTYRAQKRGGKGRSGMTTKDEDSVKELFVASTHDLVLFFSTSGRVYQLKIYKLPLGTPQSKGRPLVNVLPLQAGETISTILTLPEVENADTTYMMFATSKGHVRRNRVSDFTNINAAGKIAIKLEDDEQLVSVRICQGDEDVFLFTRLGKAIRFGVSDVRVFVGRASNGVRGVRLADQDCVMAMTIVANQDDVDVAEREAYVRYAAKMRQDDEVDGDMEDEENVVAAAGDAITLSPERIADLEARESFILTITERGYAKRTSSYEYRTTGRGGSGVRNITITDRNGPVVCAFPASHTHDVMLVTQQGQLIRCPVEDVRITGRSTQGVIMFRTGAEDRVVSVSPIAQDENEIEETGRVSNASMENEVPS